MKGTESSLMPLISVPANDAPVMMIHPEIKPPMVTAMMVSFFTNGKSCTFCHFWRITSACKNKLYGTTVVPINPTTVSRLSDGSDGLNPFNNCKKSGADMMAVAKNAILIKTTNAIKNLSICLKVPKYNNKNAGR